MIPRSEKKIDEETFSKLTNRVHFTLSQGINNLEKK